MRQNHQRGFTLIEVLIAAGLAVALLTGIMLITNTSFRQTSSNVSDTRTQTNLQAIHRMLTADLRAADAMLSVGHTSASACAFIATAVHWISYCNTPNGTNRAEAPRSAHANATGLNSPVSPGTLITQMNGSIHISKSSTQFLVSITPDENAQTTQLAITTRIGGS